MPLAAGSLYRARSVGLVHVAPKSCRSRCDEPFFQPLRRGIAHTRLYYNNQSISAQPLSMSRATRSAVKATKEQLVGHEEITGPPRRVRTEELMERDRERQARTKTDQRRTDAHVAEFEGLLFTADQSGCVAMQLRVRVVHVGMAWLNSHHKDGNAQKYHGVSRRRALVQPTIQLILLDARERKRTGRRLSRLHIAALKYLCVVMGGNPSSRLLAAPFDRLAQAYKYGNYDKMAHDPLGGGAPDSGAMQIDATTALFYVMVQSLSRRGLLPRALEQGAGCLYATSSLRVRAETGMGNPVSQGRENDLVFENERGKDRLSKLFYDGLGATGGFDGFVAYLGMGGPDYREHADKHCLPAGGIIPLASLCAKDFSQEGRCASRSAAFEQINDTLLCHGVLEEGDDKKLARALCHLRDGSTDLIESIELAVGVRDDNDRFRFSGNKRVIEDIRSWDASLTDAIALRNALAPSTDVQDFLDRIYCPEVPIDERGKVVGDERDNNPHYTIRRLLDPTLSFRVTRATNPDRGRVFCSNCMKVQPSQGRKTIKCGICESTKVKVTKEAAGKYA
jgi:hypothetical protein